MSIRENCVTVPVTVRSRSDHIVICVNGLELDRSYSMSALIASHIRIFLILRSDREQTVTRRYSLDLP